MNAISYSDKIFITGATGFVGSHILRVLLNQGYSNIYALRRNTSSDQFIFDIKDQVKWIEGDLDEVDNYDEELAGTKCIIHCAAMISFDKKEAERLFEINTEGTEKIVNLALSLDVDLLIHMSSVEAFGRNLTGVVIDEKHEWEESKLNSQYAISKQLAEREIWRGEVEGLDVVILNPSFVIGEGDYKNGPMSIFDKIKNGLSFYPTGTIGVVDVEDVAKSVLQVLKLNIRNEQIIISSDNLRHQEIFASIAEKLNVWPPQKQLSKSLAVLAIFMERWKSIIFKTSPLITKETYTIASHDYFFDNKKSKQLLNLNYTPIIETIERVADNFVDTQS